MQTAPTTRPIVARVDDLAEGQSRGDAPPGRQQHSVFVVRHRGRLHAWRDACPHLDGAHMAWRVHAYLNADGSRIVCSAHGAQFDIETGLCTLGPCLGASLTRVAMVPAGEGIVQLLEDPAQPATHPARGAAP